LFGTFTVVLDGVLVLVLGELVPDEMISAQGGDDRTDKGTAMIWSPLSLRTTDEEAAQIIWYLRV